MRPLMRCAVPAGMLFAAVACADAVAPDARRPAKPFVPATEQAAPSVTAGPDLFVALPDSTLRLRAWPSPGSAFQPSARWTKLSGPASYRITGADGYTPSLAGLEKGTYTFEIAVDVGAGRPATDTIAIHVIDGSAVRTLEFPGLTWICPMGCTSSPVSLREHLPDGALMRVLVRSGGVMTWEEVHSVWGDRFIYTVSNGNVGLYSDDEPPPVDVRILWMVP